MAHYHQNIPDPLDPADLVDKVIDGVWRPTDDANKRNDKAYGTKEEAWRVHAEAERRLGQMESDQYASDLVNNTYFKRGHDYALMCEGLGRLVKKDRDVAVYMAKGYVQDIRNGRCLEKSDQEFRHSQIMYRESRSTWMLCAAITAFVACVALGGIFVTLSNMSG